MDLIISEGRDLRGIVRKGINYDDCYWFRH